MSTTPDPKGRLHRALRSLEGLSFGDAFGDRFFTTPHTVEHWIEQRALPAGRWAITDDTVMAISIVDILSERGDTVSGLGDRDTTCAIVGGIVALDPATVIPPSFLASREPLECVSRSLLSERVRAPG